MKKKNRRPYNTTLNSELMKKIKILAAMHGKRYNDVIEEAVRDIIKKYRNKAKAKPSDDKKHKKKEK
jgi:hypothetical protein